MTAIALAAGAAAALGGRALLVRGIRAKLEHDLRALNAGDPGPLLAGYADDAVLRFTDGDHRWAGDWVGKEAIGRFLDEFVAAGITGEVVDLLVAGPPWALRFVVRFDDEAVVDGERLYANRTCLVLKTRWGKVVEHEDFYEDTARIPEFDRLLRERGRAPSTAVPA